LVEETRLHDSLAGCARVRRILKLPCRKSTLICAAYDTQRMAGVRCIGRKGPKHGVNGDGSVRDKYRSLRQAQLRFAADADHQADPTGKEVGSNPMRGCRKERPKDVRTWRAKISSME